MLLERRVCLLYDSRQVFSLLRPVIYIRKAGCPHMSEGKWNIPTTTFCYFYDRVCLSSKAASRFLVDHLAKRVNDDPTNNTIDAVHFNSRDIKSMSVTINLQ